MSAATKLDIEHVAAHDDPRQWSSARKTATLLIVSSASLITTIAAGIYNPSIVQIEHDLHATASQISWTLSLFVLIQGVVPILWSVLSELKGRKIVYIISILLFVGGSIGAALSPSIGLLIGMRCVQAAGSSAVLAIGAATLADIYDSHERGSKMGLYYSAPLLGPSIGPILGGGLTQGFDWRACFWFLVIFGGLNLASFVFLFKDTFRRERSLAYQRVLKRNIEESQRSEAQSHASSKNTYEKTPPTEVSAAEAAERKPTAPAFKDIKLSLKDADPVMPMLRVLRYLNNPVILTASGFIYGFSYSILYTSARVLAAQYGYDALHTGLVLLAFGAGSVAGSILGGKWSDMTLARVQRKSGGQRFPEMRLQSTFFGMVFLPPSIIAYGWVVHENVHIAAPVVFLFLCGLFSVWVYSSTLAYIVDANAGQSSSAVATNSLFRGLFAFAAAELAVPVQDHLGDGWMYTIWGGVMILTNVLILLVWAYGRSWRERKVRGRSCGT
ncbi:MFS general substrate transporter [Trametes versicolor FP-101664 SS1]|uniref:MFS general substrate transporter n=1 Tax=Trametes versicolor (strain FP-101664) TaxID=717944 RepID=UPI0004623B96|nr:MFS general substrate transporter [Trametes versicolor FP-101664 SS1]EIW65089.1 MFS general substrate transporter [Trametes versicolor FP-101664 SS1]